jgi:hypothetical protein
MISSLESSLHDRFLWRDAATPKDRNIDLISKDGAQRSPIDSLRCVSHCAMGGFEPHIFEVGGDEKGDILICGTGCDRRDYSPSPRVECYRRIDTV